MKSVTISTLGSNGRLANQMFQLACAYTYARNCGKMIGHPEWKYAKYFKGEWPNTKDIVVGRVYNEPTFHYSEIPCFPGEDVDIQGYWQSPLHFKGTDVNSFFELKDEYKKQVEDLYTKLNPENLITISAHHRLTDYLNSGTKEYHGNLGINYYSDAFDALIDLDYDFYNILIFSDDINSVKENGFYNKFPNKCFVDGNEDIIDLFLMARCGSNVMANSSFSYWAYLLNQNEYKSATIPKFWFGETGKHNNTKDLYLSEMIVI